MPVPSVVDAMAVRAAVAARMRVVAPGALAMAAATASMVPVDTKAVSTFAPWHNVRRLVRSERRMALPFRLRRPVRGRAPAIRATDPASAP